MRAVTSLSPQFTSFRAATMSSLALSLSDGATASSKSRQTTSAALAAAFSNRAGLDPGTKSLERYSRGGTRRSTGAKLTISPQTLALTVTNERTRVKFASCLSPADARFRPPRAGAGLRHGCRSAWWQDRHDRAWSGRYAD